MAEEERLRAEEERKREIELAYLGNDPNLTSHFKIMLICILHIVMHLS